jgi:hypothetical protein
LTVYRSVFQPTGQAAQNHVCYLLEWFADQEEPDQSQINGVCSLATQTSSVLAVDAPETGPTAVIGRAPEGATRVRLELRGQNPVESTTVGTTPDLGSRFYVAFVPSGYLERMVALDDAGRQVGQAPGPGNLKTEWTDIGADLGYPPTGPVKVVLRTTSRPGRVTLTAWPTRQGYCLSIDDSAKGSSRTCDAEPSTTSFDQEASCHRSNDGTKAIRWAWVAIGAPRATRAVRVEVAGERFEVAAQDAGEAFDQAFFYAQLPIRKGMTAVRLTALDANSQPVKTWTTSYVCP